MSRRADIKAILDAARRQHEAIRTGYDRALRDHSLDLRVPVKNLMENLRSALDYMAHDVYDSCCRPIRNVAGRRDPRNIYFPYGRTEGDFRAAIGSSLSDLQNQNLPVYELLESIQPFRSNDPWLYDLCSILNENKHDRLTAQVRSETETYSVKGDYGSVSIIVNNPTIQVTSKPGSVRLFGIPAQFCSEGIKTASSDKLTHNREKWVAFVFEGSSINVIGMLNKSVAGITGLSVRLYQLL